MNGLDDWFAAQREQLDASVWLDLTLRTARLDALVSAEYFTAAHRSLPGLYALIDRYQLPEWRVFVQLTEGALVLASTGHVSRAIDIAMQALTIVEALPGCQHMPLKLAARLGVMRCWLKIDEVGYAPEVLAIGEDALHSGAAGEWGYWFRATTAWALWALGRQDEADAALAEMLSDLPRLAAHADLLEGRAYIAYRMRRLAQAAEFYASAALAFDSDGLHHSTFRCQLNRALCLHEMGEYADSGALLDHLLRRIQSLNAQHYLGLAYCFRGRNALAVGDCESALHDLNHSLFLYEGRGWLRDEAQICLDRLEAMRYLDLHVGDNLARWNEAVADAQTALSRLKSTDLQVRLDLILNPA